MGYGEGSIKLTMRLQVRVITGPVLAEYDSQNIENIPVAGSS